MYKRFFSPIFVFHRTGVLFLNNDKMMRIGFRIDNTVCII